MVERLYPEHDAMRQHIAWLEQFIGGMTDANWKDMRLRAERQLEQLSGVVAQGWQDISTAPDDFGVQVWGWDEKRGSNPMIFCESGWRITYDDAQISPTRWMPLPDGPSVSSTKRDGAT